MKPIAVLGAGSWGTALALTLARNQQRILLWDHDVELLETLQKTRCNQRYVPDIVLPDSIVITPSLKDVFVAKDILVVVPSHAFRSLIQQIKPYLTTEHRLVWATKGMDPDNEFLHEVIKTHYGAELPIAVISGPSFALEVARGLPTAVAVAATDVTWRHDLCQRFQSPHFKVVPTDDIIGVELGGIVKNVFAIATGIFDGLGFGANARCALLTEALEEMRRLGIVLGARCETLLSLAGLGDLILTCTDDQSRNRRFGLALGAGKTVEQAQADIGQVVEGRHNVAQVYQLAQQHRIDMPIVSAVYQVLQGDKSVKAAAEELIAGLVS